MVIYKEVTSQHNLRNNLCSPKGGSFEVPGLFAKLPTDVHTCTPLYLKHLQHYRAQHSMFPNLIIAAE